ncbi:MAG TPA: RNA polymerase sigma factor [Fusibacter sp.]|nr:RNA polymerase sigma factor [Fusibacter sp.]
MQLYEIYEKYQSDLLRYAQSLCRQKEDAEDLVQQAYLKALQSMDSFQGAHPLQVKGWLIRTIKNLYIDTYRRQKRFGDFEEAPEPSYEAYIDDTLITADLLESLPVHLRTAVILRYLHDYNSQEIGEILGLNASTVRSRLSQALQLLRKTIND